VGDSVHEDDIFRCSWDPGARPSAWSRFHVTNTLLCYGSVLLDPGVPFLVNAGTHTHYFRYRIERANSNQPGAVGAARILRVVLEVLGAIGGEY
jgi:hypothetical protein